MTDHTPADELTPQLAAVRATSRSDTAGDVDPEPADWNPRGPSVRRDPLAAYDGMRSYCPVARGASGAWTLFAHADVTAAARDHLTFSNAVSRYLQVPNGLDGPVHSAYRAVVDRYFTPERMAEVEPRIQAVADELMAEVELPGPIDAVALGARFAVRAMCAWLGWPAELEDDLLRWMADNHAATRSREHARTAEVAERFDAIIRSLIEERRTAGDRTDVTTELMRDTVDGRPLTDEEIVSILRNWTGGDLGSMALCTGVLLTYLADHPELQDRLRAGASDLELDAVIDEILRIDNPFVASRRVTTRTVRVGGREVAAGERVFLNWTSANRDPKVFGDPDAFDPQANAPYNLVWGAGKHVCPGRPLATLELRVLIRAVLAATESVEPDLGRPRRRGLPPVGGYSSAPLTLR